ncbi:unnamed protein product, partial [Meganyctiphanes norvegica]
ENRAGLAIGICSKAAFEDKDNYCPNGFRKVESWCVIEGTPAIRKEAKKNCKEKGGILFTAHTKEMQDGLKNLTLSDSSWIGLNYDENWRWMEIYFTTGFQSWVGDKEPNDKSGSCAVTNIKKEYNWEAKDCEEMYPYLC